MKIIALTGRKSSGKSTVSEYLEKYWLYQNMSFAEPLKEAIIHIFDLDSESVYGDEVAKNTIHPYWGVSGRQLMQTIGTELFRNELPRYLPQLANIWVKRMEKALTKAKYSLVVINDLRFPSEAEMIRRMGGVIVRIERPSTATEDPHESESYNIVSDYTIYNTGSLEELHKRVDEIMRAVSSSPMKVV